MNIESTLNELNQGQSATVTRLLSQGGIRRRLQDIGLVVGTRVSCLQKSPLGDPVAYLVRGAVIAIRSEDSSNIIVSGVSASAAEWL